MVTPWFRFLWESYRSMLEILRTNPKLEHLYAGVASKAFNFCLQYKRTTEFKRLCDILRQHLTNLVKCVPRGGGVGRGTHSMHALCVHATPSLPFPVLCHPRHSPPAPTPTPALAHHSKFRDNRDNGPDTLTWHLDSRYEQLRAACELELWGEAFRSVEDIQQLLALTKKTPKAAQQAAYYQRLTQIFQQSDAPLHHAWSWHKVYAFTRAHTRGLQQQDYQQLATGVLLAALSVLPYDRTPPLRQGQGDAQVGAAA